jgi:hypothetical protein
MSPVTKSEHQIGKPLSASENLENARVLTEDVRQKDLAAVYDRDRKLPAALVQKSRNADSSADPTIFVTPPSRG